ncbi:uncharacterized protein LOC132705075 [Cylas formicarius]|uniref:uncharacterized protein LOC132705075 n=1 Tax=Cylas formicarius TaxID=197179 RepID=UPI002958A114|nr:uncharacterized protein LOC132705075 [Cylas formicarius]
MGDYKKNKVLRSTEIHKLNEIYDVALKVNAEDESFYPILEAMYKELEETRTNFYKLHNKIISIICDKQNADELFKIEDDFRKKIDIQYYRIQAIYTQRLMKPTTQSVAIPGEQLPISAYLNLPKPELPTFSGEVTEFRSFLDQFDARVHTVPHLKAIDKFNLLVSCLKGVARDAIDHLDITADNYTIAYDLLKERFNNVRVIASNLCNNLECSPKLTSDNSKELRSLLDTFSKNVAALQKLGLPTEHWDFILVQLMLKRLTVSRLHDLNFITTTVLFQVMLN